MGSTDIRFEDGAGYERYMGQWSRLVGEAFLAWLKPGPALRWLDVGCGNGAFTEKIAALCSPASLHGIDPSAEQVAYARTLPSLAKADFRTGDAMALPYADASFDVTVMPLVIFFLTDPATGVAEMARVTAPGGLVTAYSWDMTGGGFPYALLQAEMKALGTPALSAPSPEASRMDTMTALWTAAGLESVETRAITVERTFADFEDYWATLHLGPSVKTRLAAMTPDNLARLKDTLRARLPADASGRITYSARANAIQGRRRG